MTTEDWIEINKDKSTEELFDLLLLTEERIADARLHQQDAFDRRGMLEARHYQNEANAQRERLAWLVSKIRDALKTNENKPE